jgi:broad specificity phosphatase PhoE
MPVLYLVRHGQASYGSDDYDDLSDLGRVQAEAVGRELGRRGLRAHVAACGTLRRQRDTAALGLAAAGLGVTPTIDGRWNEYDMVEVVERHLPPGTPPHDGGSQDFQRLLDLALAGWAAAGGAAGWSEWVLGAESALAEMASGLRRGQDAIAFTSGGVIAGLVAALIGGPVESMIALNRVAVNAAVTTLLVGQRGQTLLTFNDHAFLPKEQVTFR